MIRNSKADVIGQSIRTFGVVLDWIMGRGPANLGIGNQHTQLNNFCKVEYEENFCIIDI